MILRNFKWIIAVHLLYLFIVTEAENERSYDTNDWIPITPSSKESALVEQKKATGRVLNLDAPQQKFFPEEDYRKKRPHVEQYLRETPYPKHRPHIRQQKQKHSRPYKFESVPTYQPKPQPQLQYFTNQEVKPSVVEQPPPLVQPQYVQQPPQYQAPQFIYQNQPQILPQQQYIQTYPQQIPQQIQQQIQQQIPQQIAQDPNYQQYQQYVQLNNSAYQSINPNAINQELLGAIQNTQVLQPLPTPVESTTKAKLDDKETVQLLYVPLENLKANQPISQDSQTIYNTAEVPRQEKQVTSFTSYTPTSNQRLAAIEKDFIQQALEAQKLQDQIRSGTPLTYQSTTNRPKRRKPHQPPLAVYMGGEGSPEVSDVLDLLKDAKSIAVQDNFRPNSPKVFIGPSTLNPPNGYSKFPLPYLNSIDGNRIERKIEQLPFFVAPLSYKTPDGYSKIPLPSPHVGSVVVSNKEELHEKYPVAQQPAYNTANQYAYVDKPQYLIKNYNGQEYNPQQLTLTDNSKVNNLQYPKTIEEIKETYQAPARPQLPVLPPTLQEPVKNIYSLNQDEVINNPVALEQNPAQNTYQGDISSKLALPQQPVEYEIPARSTPPPQYTNNINLNQFDVPVRSTLAPQFQDLSQFTIPSTQLIKNTSPQTDTQSFNFRDKIKTSVEITPSLEITPKSTTRGSLKEQLSKEIVSSYQPLSSSTPSPQQSYNVNPLELAINQFELEQINSQLLEKNPNQNQQASVPPAPSSLYYDDLGNGNTRYVSSTPNYENNFEVVTTPRTEKPRRRGKPSRQPNRPTQTTYDNTRYTVLEDFNPRQKLTTARPIETTKYETTPRIVYQQKVTTTANYDKTDVEHIPSKVYKLNPQVQPVYTENRPPINQHILNGELLDQQVLNSYSPNAPTFSSEQTTQIYQDLPTVEPLNSQKEVDSEQNQLLSGYISNLQDQSVRALLVPNLLVPTTEQLRELATTLRYEPSTTTEKQIQITVKSTEPPTIETTTRSRNRGRVRGNTAGRWTTTAPPRRTVNRRRPSYTRTTTERASTTTEYGKITDYTRRSVSNSKPRFRTRGRPQNSLTERSSSTTENEIKAFKQPELQSGFQASPLQGEPQSFMQFEHTIGDQKIITVSPEDVSQESQSAIKDYHQVYNLQSQSDNSNLNGALDTVNSGQPPAVDIKITHPLDEIRSEDIITKANKENQYVRFNINAKTPASSAEETTTTRSHARIRSRTRGKPRFSLTTAKTTTTTTTERDEDKEGSQEFYGFFRQPNFQKPTDDSTYVEPTQPPARYSSSYVNTPTTKTVYNEEFVANGYSTERPEFSSPVHFVGEIRPKYQTAQYEESKISIATAEQEPTTEVTTTTRTRGRIRSHIRKSEPNSVHDVTTKRSRSRYRGNSQYRLPEKVRTTTDEADVEGGNYPSSFFVSKTPTTEPAGFQITIDPNAEEESDFDQSPHPSIYSPKFIPKPNENWVDASSFPNELPKNDKKDSLTVDTTPQPLALPVVRNEPANTEQPAQNILNESSQEMSELLTQINDMIPPFEDTTTDVPTTTKPPTKKKGKRRGVWKLVRHNPVDHIETAESQNYESVLNSFGSIEKLDYRKKYFEAERTRNTKTEQSEVIELEVTTQPTEDVPNTTTPPTSASTEGNLFDALYDMFGIKAEDDTTTSTTETATEVVDPTTTTVSPTFPQEITEELITTTQAALPSISNSSSVNKIEEDPVVTTLSPDYLDNIETTNKNVATKTTYEVEPWEMKAVKTSTSTEVSHETEICYKGRCVKSLDRKVKS